MKREDFEIKIIDALDGRLSSSELRELRVQLEQFPDLLEAFELLQEPVNLKSAFPEKTPDPAVISRLRENLEAPFMKSVLHLFPRYLAAAGIAAAILIGIVRTDSSHAQLSEEQIYEWIYAADTQDFMNEYEEMMLPELTSIDESRP